MSDAYCYTEKLSESEFVSLLNLRRTVTRREIINREHSHLTLAHFKLKQIMKDKIKYTILNACAAIAESLSEHNNEATDLVDVLDSLELGGVISEEEQGELKEYQV